MGRHQNSQQIVFSLKYKILLLLMVLCILGLGVFLWISLSHFVADKRNYLLESSTQLISTETEILNREVGKAVEYIQILADKYDPATLEFPSQAKDFFARQKSIIKTQIIEFNGDKKRTGFLLNKTSEELNVDRLPFYKVTDVNKPVFICDFSDPSRIYVITRISTNAYQYVVADLKLLPVSSLMERKNFNFALICPDNNPFFLGLSQNTPSVDWENSQFKQLITSSSFTKEFKADGKDYLMSGSQIQGTNLKLLSFIDSHKAMAVIRKLQLQAVMVFLTILGLMAIIALIAANKMTSALEALTAATEKVAVGDFDISLKVQSGDEVSVLTKSFLWMKDKIVELLEKAKQATRMEAELETANLVQSTLFPTEDYVSDYAIVRGKAQSASECGGDLWHYFETDQYLFLFIGDVVGHGVPSALMTTAARSVTAILKMQNVTSPAAILKMLNHAIFETSKGKMWMTFLVARYEKSSGELVYASASHNSPFLFPNKENIKKSHIGALTESMGASLGRQEVAEYNEASIQINEGDLVLFYTDGLTECANPKSDLLGETKLVRNLVTHWNSNKDLHSFMDAVHKCMETHRAGHPFEDDVTYFAMKRIS